MQSLAALVVIVFVTIQAVALAALVAAFCNFPFISIVLGVLSAIAGWFTGRFRLEGIIFWALPTVAFVFAMWKACV